MSQSSALYLLIKFYYYFKSYNITFTVHIIIVKKETEEFCAFGLFGELIHSITPHNNQELTVSTFFSLHTYMREHSLTTVVMFKMTTQYFIFKIKTILNISPYNYSFSKRRGLF